MTFAAVITRFARRWPGAVLLTTCLLAVATAPSRLAAQSPLPHYASGVLSAVPLPSSSQPHLSAAPPFGGANITVNSPTGGQQNETTIAVLVIIVFCNVGVFDGWIELGAFDWAE